MKGKFQPQYKSEYTKILKQQYVIDTPTKSFQSMTLKTGYRLGRTAISNETKNSHEGLKRI